MEVMFYQFPRFSHQDSVKILEADIQHANALAAAIPRGEGGERLQMKLVYDNLAPIFLLLLQWMDCSCTCLLPRYLNLFHVVVYKVYTDKRRHISKHGRKATVRDFYAIIMPSLQRLHGDFVESENFLLKNPGKEVMGRKEFEDFNMFSKVDFEREDECGICLEPCTKMVLPNCCHAMCINCYHDWNTRSESCPFCRGNIKRVGSTDLWVLTCGDDVVDTETVSREDLFRLYNYIHSLPREYSSGRYSGSNYYFLKVGLAKKGSISASVNQKSVKRFKRQKKLQKSSTLQQQDAISEVERDGVEPSVDNMDQKTDHMTIPSRDTVLRACITTSGLIAALGVFVRQVSHFASLEGLPVFDCSAEIKFSSETWHFQLIAGVVILISSCRYLLLNTSQDFAESSEAANQQVLSSLQPLDLIIVAFLPGISEELLFRGALLPLFGMNWKSAMLVGAIFGVSHLGGGRKYPFAIWATFVGFIYGYATILSSSLIVPMASHAANNLVGGLLWRYSSKSQK